MFDLMTIGIDFVAFVALLWTAWQEYKIGKLNSQLNRETRIKQMEEALEKLKQDFKK